jgi:hypothetical protein
LSQPFADEHGATLRLRAGFDLPTLFAAGMLLMLLGVLSAAYSPLAMAGKGALTACYGLLIVHWIRSHRRQVPPGSRLHLLPDGDVLLRLDSIVTWRGLLEPGSWRSPQLVLLRVRLPFGSLWLPIWRHRQLDHEFRRLLVGLRHGRWEKVKAIG